MFIGNADQLWLVIKKVTILGWGKKSIYGDLLVLSFAKKCFFNPSDM